MANKVLIILVLAVVIVISVLVAVVIAKKKSVLQQTSTDSPIANKNQISNSKTNPENNNPILIKNLPVNFAPYDPTTNMAGDFKFTKQKLQFDRLLMDYGFYIPASPDKKAKNNPQPAFIVPLGTKVMSIVDGVVVDIPKLYSDDFSVMVARSNNDGELSFETEHVKNVVVKVGDTVKAGDIIAEASDYNSQWTPGFGLVEIGILKGGNPPHHLCPYLFLDPSAKENIFASLKTFYSDWNTYTGKTLYNLSDYKTIGCLVEGEIEG